MSRILPALIFSLFTAVCLCILWNHNSLGGDANQSSDDTPRWIWIAKQSSPKQTALFRKTFTAPAKIKSAKLYATCDDQFWAYVNGREVLRGETWQAPSYADVTKQLKAGKNILAFRGRNQQSNIAGLLAKLVIETDNDKTIIVSDKSWRVASKGRKGWQSAKFNDEAWTSPVELGKLGDGPWVSVNARSLANAAVQRDVTASYNQLRTLKDFNVEQLYSVPTEQGSWVSMTTDPKGRLIASDQYGKIYRITPPAIGEKGETKVEPLDIALGEAQGLLWAFDSLYVVVNRGGKYKSGLYRVRDTDNDGELDNVEMLRELQGGGEHGPHAVILSPDKKSLFICAGNHTNLTDIDPKTSRVPRHWGEDSLLPRLWDATGHAVGRKAPAGCIYNVSPDGKNWALWCMGFRNEYDIAFNRDGELFTYDSDMEWDMNTPWYRPTRVYHCTSGAEFGWRGGTAKYPSYYPDTLPPVVDVGPGSPTGIVFGYGAKFPAKYQDALFICDWSYGKLYAVHLTPHGSTYTGKLEEFVTGTPLPLTDIVVNPKDGAMYFAVGGRRVKSALYRVTYTGKESTAPSKSTSKGRDARASRHKLEALHRSDADANAITTAWPYLKHEDRFMRWAARTAIEHQDIEKWRKQALSEMNPQATIEAVVALLRSAPKNDAATQTQALQALDRLQWKDLPESLRFALLRAYGLTFIRMGPPSDQVKQKLIAKFDPHYPSDNWEMNWELSKLLVYLGAPNAAAKTLALIRSGATQEEQMAYALSLRNLKDGWTMKQRQEYFHWFPKALGYKGGNSFQGFVRNIRSGAVAHLSGKDKKILQPILDARPIEKPVPVAPPREFVKKWKVDDVADVIEKSGLKNRNFNRGRTMFAAARCFACHRYGNEGGAAGPDLTGVSGRFSPRDLLISIIEPSKTVSDQYEAVTIVTKGGQVHTGRIVNLAGDSLRVNTDMYNPNKLVAVNRRQVLEVIPSKTSMMPEGLIDTMNREEILDLMAYLLSRGDRNHAMFRKE